MIIALVVCVLGFLLSLLFCADIGYILLDIVDHYVTTYIMLTLGVLQCAAVGWVYEVKEIKEKVRLRSIVIFTA